MDNHALLKRLRKTFLGEFEELVGTLERNLLALERAEDPSLDQQCVHELFRAAHSLKGAARAVDLDQMVAITHALESELEKHRNAGSRPPPGTVRRLFDTIDRLKEAGAVVAHEESLQATAAKTGAAQGTADGARGVPGVQQSESRQHERPRISDSAPAPAYGDATDFVRIAATQLDRLVALASELLVVRRHADLRHDEADELTEDLRRTGIARRSATGPRSRAAIGSAAAANELDRMEERLGALTKRLAQDALRLDQLAAPLEREVLRVRMMPFSQACEGFDRAVRDLAHEAGKSVRLELQGQDLELDRAIARGIRGALLHLIRNAVSHGLEPEAERHRAGKAAMGLVRLSARLAGGRMEVSVTDDGRGLDSEAILARAAERGIRPEDGADTPERLIFSPGFSTAAHVTTVAGRGVGLDAVSQTVAAQRGHVTVDSRPGAGTTFTLSLPLSLTSIRALLVRAAGQVFALDTEGVRGLKRIGADDVLLAEGREMLCLDDEHVPVLALAECLGLRPREAVAGAKTRAAVVLASETLRAAFLVDEFIAELPILVKDLGPRLQGLPLVKAGTILDNGAVGLILDASRLLQDGCASGRRDQGVTAAGTPPATSKRILLADDSVTTRALVRSILEAAGYDVVAVSDGAAAWDKLQDESFDLLVSDVEMPRMDGFLLTESIRQSRRLRHLPVVLVTARESDADRLRGAEAGADAYLGKSAFDQTQLLVTLGQIL